MCPLHRGEEQIPAGRVLPGLALLAIGILTTIPIAFAAGRRLTDQTLH